MICATLVNRQADSFQQACRVHSLHNTVTMFTDIKYRPVTFTFRFMFTATSRMLHLCKYMQYATSQNTLLQNGELAAKARKKSMQSKLNIRSPKKTGPPKSTSRANPAKTWYNSGAFRNSVTEGG